VTRAVETDEIKSRVLKGGEVLAVLHHGLHETLKEGYRRLFGYIQCEAFLPNWEEVVKTT